MQRISMTRGLAFRTGIRLIARSIVSRKVEMTIEFEKDVA